MLLILQTLWLLLPAGLANMAPVFAATMLPFWNTPVDFGRSWKGHEIFGSHKTYRGLISGLFTGLLIFMLQQSLYRSVPFFKELSLFNYDEVNPFFGAWMGISALLGDLIKSFFKRRYEIAPGKPWIPFDQIDWIVGALLAVCVVFIPSLAVVTTSFIMGLGLHFFIKYVGFLWKLSPTPL